MRKKTRTTEEFIAAAERRCVQILHVPEGAPKGIVVGERGICKEGRVVFRCPETGGEAVLPLDEETMQIVPDDLCHG